MLQAHSLLWHYLWVAPNLFLLILAALLWKRHLHRRIPAFFVFSIISALGQLSLYIADILPTVKWEVFWQIDWADLLLEGLLKFWVLSEIFAHVFGQYDSIARMGKTLIRAVAIVSILSATFAAAYAPRDGSFPIISGANFLEQTTYIIECGLLLSIVLFSAFFHLSWDRMSLGITLGMAISACVHLAVWAWLLNAGISNPAREGLVFLKMAAYNLCVLLWCYYLLTKAKITITSALPLPENNLALWNRELERLLQ